MPKNTMRMKNRQNLVILRGGEMGRNGTDEKPIHTATLTRYFRNF